MNKQYEVRFYKSNLVGDFKRAYVSETDFNSNVQGCITALSVLHRAVCILDHKIISVGLDCKEYFGTAPFEGDIIVIEDKINGEMCRCIVISSQPDPVYRVLQIPEFDESKIEDADEIKPKPESVKIFGKYQFVKPLKFKDGHFITTAPRVGSLINMLSKIIEETKMNPHVVFTMTSDPGIIVSNTLLNSDDNTPLYVIELPEEACLKKIAEDEVRSTTLDNRTVHEGDIIQLNRSYIESDQLPLYKYPMLSEFIKDLQNIFEKYGDLPVRQGGDEYSDEIDGIKYTKDGYTIGYWRILGD